MTTVAHLYCLTSPSGRSYFGIAKNVRKRWQEHQGSARSGSRGALHSAIRKYGWQAFKAEVLVTGSVEYIKELECKAIAVFGSMVPNGYNLTVGGDGTHGYKWDRTKVSNIADKNRGRKRSEESRLRMSEAQKGKTRSDDQKRKIGAVSSSVVRTESWRNAISQSLKGIVQSEDTRRARAENQRALWKNPEYRKMMLAARKRKRDAA